MVEAIISNSYCKFLPSADGSLFRWWQRSSEKFWLRSDPWEPQWNCHWGLGQLGDARESLTCAVTQSISTISSNPQGYHFSCSFLLDCFCHHKSRCSGCGREEAITLKGCSALQNNIQLGCGPEELQHFRDFTSTLHSVYKKLIHWLSHLLVCASLVTLCA